MAEHEKLREKIEALQADTDKSNAALENNRGSTI
jgi:hypothetical protein